MADDRLLLPAPEAADEWTRPALRGSPLVAALAQAVLDARAKEAEVRKNGSGDDGLADVTDASTTKTLRGLILIRGGRNEEDRQ